jgi:hypothetical protein
MIIPGILETDAISPTQHLDTIRDNLEGLTSTPYGKECDGQMAESPDNRFLQSSMQSHGHRGYARSSPILAEPHPEITGKHRIFLDEKTSLHQPHSLIHLITLQVATMHWKHTQSESEIRRLGSQRRTTHRDYGPGFYDGANHTRTFRHHRCYSRRDTRNRRSHLKTSKHITSFQEGKQLGTHEDSIKNLLRHRQSIAISHLESLSISHRTYEV